MKDYRMHLLVCSGERCHGRGSEGLLEQLDSILIKENLLKEVRIIKVDCFALCDAGPIIWVYPDNIVYSHVQVEDLTEIVNEHIKNGRVVSRLLYQGDALKPLMPETEDLPWHNHTRIALRNCGFINPESIYDYIEALGYEALGRVLKEMTPGTVIENIKKSGLRGRGGGGFPVGRKWEMASQNPSDKKYIICNADEGDPGAFMDRSILEGDPHSILEAMAIAGYAIGADEGIIYIRAEYPLAVQRLQKAIKQAEEFGFLGENIFNSGFRFNIRLSLGAGAFVCGEETALINSIEGLRGEPRVKPPYPAYKGLWQHPTCINNVETLANICPIIIMGWDWYSSVGSENSKGTKVFALAGKINNVGLAEVPMGTSLRKIIYNIGGGIKGGKKLKAVQTGGPSGGCIPAQNVNTPIDYESLIEIGTMMGSGGMIVMDEDDCMVNIAKFYLEFTVEESCGKCTPCRIGTTRLYEMLTRITEGHGTMKDLDDLQLLGEIIKDCSLCGLGQSAPNPVLSTLKYFWDEYVAHVVDKKCPAGVCKNLITYKIVPEKCIGCTLCAINCPVKCIKGERKQPHVIDESQCIKCGTCMEKCPVAAIIKE